MTFYHVQLGMEQITLQQAKQLDSNLIIVLKPDEKPEASLAKHLNMAQLQKEESIRFCKAEQYAKYYAGTFSIPVQGETGQKNVFAYYIDEHVLVFLDKTEFVQTTFSQILQDTSWTGGSVDMFFSWFLERFISEDSIYLLEMQEQIETLEEISQKGSDAAFNNRIMLLRKELLVRFCYYEQLTDVCEKFAANTSGLYASHTVLSFQRLSEKAGRLLDEVKMLREYTAQVRELYQAQQDAHQNGIMKTLTTVTTIFFPLSLIASWYGMNFVNMPELKWHYGYFVVIAVSAVVLALETMLFTHKKFWK